MEAIFGVYGQQNGVLNAKVLLLNKSFEPLTVCNAKKALILLFLEKAEMVEYVDEKFVHSSRDNYPFPSVIKLKTYIHIPYKKVLLTRKNILRRDQYKCAYCGRSDIPLTIDHVIPRYRGGDDTWENLVSACRRCNNKKGGNTPDEADMPLKIIPYKPNHILFIKNAVNRIHQSWKPYLFQS